jgi:hypothetical protein
MVASGPASPEDYGLTEGAKTEGRTEPPPHPPVSGARIWGPTSALALVHLVPSLWLLGAGLSGARVLFFRDVTAYYYPAYVFVERAFAAGVWPLWIPGVQAGAPFLATYPIDLALIWLFGAHWTLALMPLLHLWLALCGASWLAQRLGASPVAAWVAGSAFGLSGYVLSTANLVPLLQAAAWAPWVIGSFLAVLDRPSRRNAARLAAVSALQVTTLAAEIGAQTAVVGLVLAIVRRPARPRRTVAALALAALLAAAMSAPTLAGLGGLLEGTQRARGFTPAEAFSYSVRPVALLDLALPRFFGDVHSFSDAGFWGQPFFPEGYPYLLGLYLGPAVLVLALAANVHRRLWAVALLGAALAMGSYGPIAGIMGPLMRVSRAPVKYLFMSTLALALLAGVGFDRLLRARRGVRLLVAGPGLALVCLGLLMLVGPGAVPRLFGARLPELLDPRALLVARESWPVHLFATGGLIVVSGMALWLGRHWVWVAALAIGLDLTLVNGEINTFADRRLHLLRPAVSAAVKRAAAEAPGRFLSFGGAGAVWRPDVASRARDTWLYAVERQTLSPWHNILDGVDSALDFDRTGWAPAGATLTPDLLQPGSLRRIFPVLRLAGIRWVLSFEELPPDLVREREQIPFEELQTPLRLYEVVGALPAAFYVARHELVASAAAAAARAAAPGFEPLQQVLLDAPPAGPSTLAAEASTPARVALERPDPHTIVVRGSTPPGFIVVLEGHHRHWTAAGTRGPLPILRANGRYWAFATEGGEVAITARFRPPWRAWTLLAAATGALGTLVLLTGPERAG